MNEELIAPYGMNCGICSNYLAMQSDVRNKGIKMTYCSGCRPREKNCSFIKKRCDLLQSRKIMYCYQCDDFPCSLLQKLDDSYSSLYRMSMIGNLEYIEKNGIQEFLRTEEEKWKCPQCGGMISCHNGICFRCELDKLREKKKLYRWEDD